MSNKKLILSFSAICLIGITIFIIFLTANNGVLNNINNDNQNKNTERESKEEKIVSDVFNKIINQSLETVTVPVIETKELIEANNNLIKEQNSIETKEDSKNKTENKTDSDNIETYTQKKDDSSDNVDKNTNTDQPVNESDDNLYNNKIEEITKTNKTNNSNELQENNIKPEVPVITSTITSTKMIVGNFGESINAKEYVCYYGTNANELINKGTIISTLNNNYQCSISNLTEGTYYYFKIVAVNGEMTSDSEIKTVKTDYSIPEMSSIISHIETHDKIKVSYSLSENAKNYVCKYKLSSDINWNTSSNLVINEDNIYCEINNLEENNLYDIQLIAINGDKEKSSEVNKFQTSYKIPDKAIIKNINTSKNSVDIYFNKPLNSTSYICRYGLNQNSLNNFGSVSVKNDEVNCSIKNLANNTKYFVEIISYNHSVSQALDIFEVTTNQLVELSEPVLINTKSLDNSIEANFNVYLGNPTNYSCRYGLDKSSLNNEGKIINKTNTSATCKLENLEEGKVYYVSLSATNDDFTKISEIYSVKTEYKTPSKSILNDSQIDANSITANFTLTDNTKSYKCYYGTNESNVNIEVTTSVNDISSSCKVNNLVQGTDYYLKMVSINGDKINSSDIYNIKTNYITPEKPILKYIYNNYNSIKLIYSKSTNATDYIAYYGLAENKLYPINVTVNNDNIEVNIANLNSKTDYFIKLTAINNYEKTNSSELIKVSTIEKELVVPTLLNSVATDNNLTLTYNVEDNLDLYVCYYGSDKDNLNYTTNAIKTKENTRQCVINNLNENTTYYYKLNVIKDTAIVNSTVSSNKTDYKIPSMPVLNKKSTTNNTLNVAFNVDENISSYTCKMGTDINNLNTVINATKTNNIVNCNANSLLSKTTYYVELSVTNGTKSIKSEIQSLTTEYSVPTKPVFINEIKTDNSIIANFSLSENTTDYICYIGTSISNMNVLGNVNIEADKVKCSFQGLNNGTTYFYKIVSTNHNEIFTNSDIKMAVTEYSEPDKPIASSIYNTTDTITITYPTSDNSKSYTCNYGQDINNLNNKGIVSITLSNTVTCTATNLNEKSNYYFSLTAKNGTKSTTSDTILVSTAKTEIKEEVALETSVYNSIAQKFDGYLSVNYSIVKDAYIQYCYYGTDSSNLNYRVTASKIDGFARCQMENIDSDADYFVKMRAYKQDGITYSESDITKIESTSYTPEAPVLNKTVKDMTNIINTYSINGNTTGFKCYIGTSPDNMQEGGTFAQHGLTEYCAFSNLNPGTKYYTKLVNIFNKKQTSSEVKEIFTNSLNGCLGDGSSTANIGNYGTKVNSTCALNESHEEVGNAKEVALALASVDTLKVLKDYPTYNFKSIAEFQPIVDKNMRYSGYYITVTLFTPGNIADVIGQYQLDNNFNRLWIKDLY